DDLAMYRLDEALGLWVPAATNPVGSAVPTTVVGDFGYTDQTDEGDLAVWAIVDRVGDFAVGRRFADDLTINVVTSTGGTISVAPDQATYAAGTIITLMAVPDEGYHFVEWSAGPPAALDDAPNSPTIEFVLTTDTQVGATFALDTPDITGPRVFVVSINIADPAAIQIVDRVDVAGESLDIQVTENAIYVLGDDPTMADTTRINYVDISDPDGDVALRDTFRVPGKVEDRFFADEYDGVLRIITEDRSLSPWDPVVALYLYDVGDPDDVERIGQLTIETGESLRSVRFDGTRGYAVTFRQIDPLFVLDLSDPANPEVTGELLVPGWSTHLVPLGDRLVGVGFDDTRGFRPAVSLYDVSDPANPWERNRIILGEKWTFDTTSEATVDEKALKVLEDEGLILIPYSSYDAEQGRFVDSLQMIDLGSDWLTERGFIEHRGLVRRAGVADARLWVLSDEAFQVADIADRDDAIPLAAVDIMSEQELLDAGLTDCADSARFRGFDEIGFVPIDGEPIILTGEGLCGNVGMIGLMALPLSLALLHQIRRPGRWPHRARRATP
ncbi:MAG: hypothetical protein GY778_31800, partial [bacterium]|nr:hypothetical protein [bacterium]